MILFESTTSLDDSSWGSFGETFEGTMVAFFSLISNILTVVSITCNILTVVYNILTIVSITCRDAKWIF